MKTGIKTLFFSALLISSLYTLAQDTVPINKWGQKTTRAKADFFRLVTPEADLFLVKDFYPDGEIQMLGHSLYRDTMVKMGPFQYYHRNGKISEEGSYQKSQRVGEWKSYWADGALKIVQNYNKGKAEGPFLVYRPDGTLKRKDSYKDGELVEKKCFGIDGRDTAWYDFSTMPEFPGGEKARINFLIGNVVYPQYAREAGIQGTVYLNFTVLKTGKLTNINVIRGVHESLDKESLRVIRLMPDWIPGKLDGEAVNVEFNMPLKFTLVDSGPNIFKKKRRHR